ETKETVNLYILEGLYRVCVEQFESIYSLKNLVPIGKRLTLWAGAGGKSILAFQNEKFKSQVFQMVDTEERLIKLKKELSIIYTESCSYSQEDRELGLSAVSIPLFNSDGGVS